MTGIATSIGREEQRTRLDRLGRWLDCCYDRIVYADEAYRSARRELEEATSAYDSARQEYDLALGLTREELSHD